jgi:hypothetical protein
MFRDLWCSISIVVWAGVLWGEANRWMGEMLQSQMPHLMLAFYRARRFGHSWHVSPTNTLDTCALLIVGGDGLPREQARLTYRIGLRLLTNLAQALGITVTAPARPQLTEVALPSIRASLTNAVITLDLGPAAGTELVYLSERCDFYVQALGSWLTISMPLCVSPLGSLKESRAWELLDAAGPIDL